MFSSLNKKKINTNSLTYIFQGSSLTSLTAPEIFNQRSNLKKLQRKISLQSQRKKSVWN
jgi:hypothetical protein